MAAPMHPAPTASREHPIPHPATTPSHPRASWPWSPRSGRYPVGGDGGEIGPGRRVRAVEMRCGRAARAIRFVGGDVVGCGRSRMRRRRPATLAAAQGARVLGFLGLGPSKAAAVAGRLDRRALGDIGNNLAYTHVIDGKRIQMPEGINRPITRSFGAQLLKNAQANAAALNKVRR
uniref:Uncharacterized protein n=1 Tax=Arundo donax TaxID=35708 RepID=A0A0A8YRI3_ARUDO